MKNSKINILCIAELIVIVILLVLSLVYIKKYKDSQEIFITGTYSLKAEAGPSTEYIVLNEEDKSFEMYNSDGHPLLDGSLTISENIITVTSLDSSFPAVYSHGTLYVYLDNSVEIFTKTDDILVYVTTKGG